MTPTIDQRKRRNRIMLGVSLSAIVLWIVLMCYIQFGGRKDKSIFVFIPFIFIAALNAFNAYKRLKQLNEEESGRG